MQIPSRGITLDQLRQDQAVLRLPGESEALTDNSSSARIATTSSTQQPYAVLDTLLQAFAPAQPLAQALSALAALVRGAIETDLCLVMLADHGQMMTCASSPDLNGYVPPLSVERSLWEKLQACGASSQLSSLNIQEREQLNPLKNVEYETLLIVPLITNTECIGLLNCYSSKNRDYTEQEQVLLKTIAGYAALAIQHRQLDETAMPGNSVKAFFDDLLTAKPGGEEALRGRAASLGCDITRPHVMTMIEVVQVRGNNEPQEAEENQLAAFKSATRQVKYRIQENYPGSLLDERGHILYAIIALDKDFTAGGLKTWLSELVRQGEYEQHVSMYAGVSSICHDIKEYRRGFAEAEEALQIGQYLSQHATSMHFSELGAYRYVYAFARTNRLPDLYLEQIAAIARYDEQHKRSELLDTLELFLVQGGSIKDTSELLHIHRNTLTQRLERIQALCTAVNLDQPCNRLPLQVAIMIHKLRTRGV